MFRFTCPICHHGLKAAEALFGKRVKCPGCGEVITVPEPVAAPDEPMQPSAPVPPAAGPHRAPPSEEAAQPGGKETSPWWYEEVKVGHGASEAASAPPPAFRAPPVPPAIARERPHPAVIIAYAAPAVVPPLTAEHAPDPALAAPPAQPVIAEEHPRSPAFVPDATPTAHHPSATELRAAYFAPGGYARSGQLAVPFMAPDLRRRLGLAPAGPETPEDRPSRPPAPADLSAYLVTQTPVLGARTRHAATPAAALRGIDPVLAGVFLTHGEGDPRVPRAAVRAYLKAPAVLGLAIELRDRVIRNWAGGGPPLTAIELLATARDVVDDAPTALLLCHNVTRAFAHGSNALSWHLLDPARGEYTDGSAVYTAEILHPAGAVGPADNPIFFALFAAGDLGTAAPPRWARHFAIAAAGAYAASSRLATDGAPATPFASAWSRDVEEVTRSMVDRSQPPSPGYRAWLWAGALSLVSLAGVPTEAEDPADAGLDDLRAVVFGLAQAGADVDSAWLWHAPSGSERTVHAAGWALALSLMVDRVRILATADLEPDARP